MATLTFAAGTITSTITATNTKAQRIVDAIVGPDGTNAEKADAFMAWVKSMIVNEARRSEAIAASEAAAVDSPEWENQ